MITGTFAIILHVIHIIIYNFQNLFKNHAQFYKYAFEVVRSGYCALDCGPQFRPRRCCFFDRWQLSIIESIVYGVGTLPEAKLGPVKENAKKRDGFLRVTRTYPRLD